MIPEIDVAKRFNVQRGTVTAFRRLYLSPDDFFRENKWGGRRIFWTDEAVAKFELHKKAGEVTETQLDNRPDTSPPVEKLGSTPAPAKGEPLTVTLIPMNPRIMDAKTQDGKIVRLAVQSNLIYSIGDMVFALPPFAPGELWTVLPPKPSFKGDTAYKWKIRNLFESYH